MFKAKMHDGVIVNVETIKREDLKEQVYYCPYCNHEVIVRAGDKYRRHFSHKNVENCHYERESIKHYEGKLTLYKWLIEQHNAVEIEYYLKDINRIADLYGILKDTNYVIELQCSHIKPELIKERTDDYTRLRLHVIWIIFKDKITLKKTRKLTEFEIACIKNDQIYYFDGTSIFIYTVMMNSSSNTFFGVWKKRGLKALKIEELITPKQETNFKMNWAGIKQKWRVRDHLFHIKYNRSFANYVYNNGFIPSLFPTEIGVQVKNQYLIKMNPFIWQSYVYIYIFLFEEVEWYDLYHYCKHTFRLRMNDDVILEMLIQDYLNYLIKRNCIQILDNVIFRKDMKRSEASLETAILRDRDFEIKMT